MLIARTALTPIIWGTTYIVTTSLLPAGHPITAGMLRALPAGIILLLVRRKLPRGSWWWKSVILGALNIGIFFWLLFVSAEELPGGIAAILIFAAPAVATALSPILLNIIPRKAQVFSVALAFFGVIAITLTPGAKLTFIGVLAGLGGALCMGSGMVLAKRWGQPPNHSPLDTTAWQLTTGGAMLVPFALLEGPLPNLDLGAIGGYAYLCLFGALFAYPNLFAGLAKLDITISMLLGALSPITALLIDAALGNLPNFIQVLGIVVVFIAIFLAQKQPRPLTLKE